MSYTDPANCAIAITPSDTANLAATSRGIMVTVAGTVKVDMEIAGTGITFTLLAGVVYPLKVKRIYSTGTSATGIIALW